jgi:hypothetical protein
MHTHLFEQLLLCHVLPAENVQHLGLYVLRQLLEAVRELRLVHDAFLPQLVAEGVQVHARLPPGAPVVQELAQLVRINQSVGVVVEDCGVGVRTVVASE